MKSGGAVRAQFVARKSIADRNLTLTPVAMKHPLTLPGIIARKEERQESDFGVDILATDRNQGNFGLRISDCGDDYDRSITPQRSFLHFKALVVIIDGFAIDTRGENHA
jgi:hypothetical protein